MDSVKRTLNSIVSASQGVQAASAQYADATNVRQLRGISLIRLEIDLQSIAAACRAVLEILNDSFLSRQYSHNNRLMDWLSNTEPETCLATLKEMQGCLRIDNMVVQPFGSTEFGGPGKEAIEAMISLFEANRTHFHFLLTTDIWNYETRAPKQTLSVNVKNSHDGKDEQQFCSTAMTRTMNEEENMGKRQSISRKLDKLLHFLDALDCTAKQKETASLRQSDTCMWLRSTQEYKSWKDGGISLLVLQGKAGAGKSVLASSLIEDLLDAKHKEELLLYFYCDFRTKRSTSAVEVMRSILAQLISHLCDIMGDPEDLLDSLLKETNSYVDSFYNIKGLSHHLCKIAKLCRRKPFVVVDALDECREAETLVDGLIFSSGDIRIFATTRPLQNILDILSPFPCISMDRMANELSVDIMLHVTRELDSRPRLRRFDGRLKDEIRSKLCARAEGMFRWVQCQIDTLEKCSSVSEIRRVLESLPEGLEETYRRILLAIDRRLDEACIARRALMWLVAALRPMRMRELLEGLAISPTWRALDPRFTLVNSANLLEICRSLVVHNQETDIITLSHMSVKEYLVGELVRAKLPRYHIIVENAHEQLARRCMAYIAFCLDQINESRHRSPPLMREHNLRHATSYASRPLLEYVLSDGFNHLAHLGPGNGGIYNDIRDLQVTVRRHTWEWDWLCNQVPSTRTGVRWPTSEHDFAFYTLIAFASDALFRTFDRHVALEPMDGTNPLVYAAQFGKLEHARALISQGARVNGPGLVVDGMGTDELDEELDGEDSGMDTENGDRQVVPLEVAVDRWHTEMIDLLLAEGSVVPGPLLTRVLTKQPDEFPLYIIRRLLQTAEFAQWAVTSWNNQLLLEAMVEREGQDRGESGAGDFAICVQRLIEVGCARTLSGDTILHIAAERGSTHTILRLLSTNTTLPLDILSSALRGTSSERIEIVRLLIRQGADVNPLAINGDTSLHITIKSSNEFECLKITQILVEAGSDPCLPDADDRSPIHLAVSRGFISVVEYLLSKGVLLPHRILFTAMHVTLARDKMIRLLLSKGANLDILDDATLLQIAIGFVDESDSLEIAKIIVDAGYSPSAHRLHGEVPLQLKVANYLLSSLPSEDIFFSLSYSNPPSRAETLPFVLGKVQGVWPAEESKRTLQDIIRQSTNSPDRCLRLAEAIVSIQRNLPSCDYRTVLALLFESAVAHGSFPTVKYLHSQDIPLPPRILFNVLSRESPSANDVELGDLFLAKKANVRVLGDNGGNLLHVAASMLSENLCLKVTKILIKAGCNPSALNDMGESPVEIAAIRGFVIVVQYLLSLGVSQHSTVLFTVLERHQTTPAKIICIAQMLTINNRAAVRATALNGDSLVHVAIKSFKEQECLLLTRIFAKAGCNLSTLNALGQPPIWTAMTRKFLHVARYLLFKGVSIPRDILHAVFENPYSFEREPEIVAFLIGKGADVRVRVANLDTPLHGALASPQGHALARDPETLFNTVKLLVQAGGDPHAPNALGRTPLDLAMAMRYHKITRYFLHNDASSLYIDL